MNEEEIKQSSHFQFVHHVFFFVLQHTNLCKVPSCVFSDFTAFTSLVFTEIYCFMGLYGSWKSLKTLEL